MGYDSAQGLAHMVVKANSCGKRRVEKKGDPMPEAVFGKRKPHEQEQLNWKGHLTYLNNTSNSALCGRE